MTTTSVTAHSFLASRYHMSAKAIEKATGGKLTARTIRKARQGLQAAIGRISEYIESGDVAPPTPIKQDVTPTPAKT